MKAGGTGKHAFGDAKWWGKELFGIDNALVGDWPVVVIEGGKAKIKAFKSIPAWWAKHSKLMIKHIDGPRRDVESALLNRRNPHGAFDRACIIRRGRAFPGPGIVFSPQPSRPGDGTAVADRHERHRMPPAIWR